MAHALRLLSAWTSLCLAVACSTDDATSTDETPLAEGSTTSTGSAGTSPGAPVVPAPSGQNTTPNPTSPSPVAGTSPSPITPIVPPSPVSEPEPASQAQPEPQPEAQPEPQAEPESQPEPAVEPPDEPEPEPEDPPLGEGGTGNVENTNAGDGGMSTGEGGAMSQEPEPPPLEGCEGGPLDAPIEGCTPEPVPDTGDFYADCVARINQLRWECQCLPPLERWTEGESCADQHSEYDYEQDRPHAGISDGICDSGGSAQNECPGYGPNFGIVDFCLQQMWDEGPGEDFQAHGHYLNMSNERFTRVACGIYTTPDGEIWSVQNFN